MGRGDADLLIVVEDNNHVLVEEACMVHGLVGHATSDSSIANHCNAVVLPALHPHGMNFRTDSGQSATSAQMSPTVLK